jgi:hypothetical protein
MARRSHDDIPHPRVRTAIANGGAVLNGVDGRSHVARRYRELGALIASDLGGHAHLTEAQKQLVRSAAGLVVLRESLDVQVVDGKRIDVGEYCALSNTLRRVLCTLGLQRVARDIDGIDSDDPAFAIFQRRLNRDDDAEAGSEIE